MWKTLIMIGSVVTATWAVESRYALAEEVKKMETRVTSTLSSQISANTGDIQSGQQMQAKTSAEIEAKLNFFLQARKDDLMLRKVKLERQPRSDLEELEYQQVKTTLTELEKVL